MTEELEIAKSLADVLDQLQRSSYESRGCTADRRRRHSATLKLGREELELARLSGMTAELALSRARGANRDFRTVMAETELGVSAELARILAATVDPVLDGLGKAAVVDGGGEVCGVCQEEMEGGDDARAMGCYHKFHGYCILKWLKHKNACPLCRYQYP